mgnify:CR=1 FL=1|jgi:hypothetical protein
MAIEYYSPVDINGVLTQSDHIEIGSGKRIRWGAGDALIQEGVAENYALEFQTYNGSSMTEALRLSGNNTATFSGVVDITDTTDSSDATGDTGALRCEGGASIAKKLFAGSAITSSNDVVAFSDRKLKDNIQTLDGKKVLDMRGVSFTRKDTGEEGSGVIAQEIQKVAPELIHDTNGTLGVAYGNLVGYLIEAIKDQQKQIDELRKNCNGCSR